MLTKRLLCPARIRKIPAQFSWIDQRLVRERLISRCSIDALALYFFLVTVADAQGLSYYSDQSILQRLSFFDSIRLGLARAELQRVEWIAYVAPLYQVLALDTCKRSEVPEPLLPRRQKSPIQPRAAQPVEAIKLLRRALEGGHD